MARKNYPSDISDAEWEFVAPYLTLMTQDAPQRRYALRELFDAVRWLARAGAQWRMLPGDLPPWTAVYQQFRRWLDAGCFEHIVHDLRQLIRIVEGKDPNPTAVIFDGRTLRSTPESGSRAGFDGHKMTQGSKVHLAVDTLGLLLALVVTPANEQERAQVGELAAAVQKETGNHVQIAFVDQGYTGPNPAEAAREHGMELQVVRLPGTKNGFVLLPRRWVVERSNSWLSRARRLARDYERLPEVLNGLHYFVFVTLMLARLLTDHKVHNSV